jgi:CRISPR-associated protein Cas1
MIKKTISISNPVRIRAKLNQLLIQDQLGEVHSRPLEDYMMMLIDHPQVSITIPALVGCIEHQISVVVCDDKHLPVGMWIPMYGHTQSTGRTLSQVAASKPLKKNMWQKIVMSKVRNQARHLRSIGIDAIYLDHLANTVRSGDTANAEAQAASWYWKRLLPNQKFIRDRFGETPNQLLNYGYIILRSSVARALVLAGLYPLIGIHHKNQYNHFCLADDVMEPFRPSMDRHILRILDSNEFTEEQKVNISPEVKREIIHFLQSDIRMDDQLKPIQVAIQSMCSSLARCFEEASSAGLLLPEFHK